MHAFRSRSLTVSTVSVTVALSLLALSVIHNSTPSAEASSPHHFSGEALLKGIFFGVGPVASLIPEMRNVIREVNPQLLTSKALARGRNRIIHQIRQLDRGFFPRFAKSMQSGQPVLVESALKQASRELWHLVPASAHRRAKHLAARINAKIRTKIGAKGDNAQLGAVIVICPGCVCPPPFCLPPTPTPNPVQTVQMVQDDTDIAIGLLILIVGVLGILLLFPSPSTNYNLAMQKFVARITEVLSPPSHLKNARKVRSTGE